MTEKKKRFIMMDVGGTAVKCGIMDDRGVVLGDGIISFPIKAMADRDEILDQLAYMIKSMIKTEAVETIAGVGMAFPGPFDYERGISLMKGLSKYDSIYGLPLAKELRTRCVLPLQVPFYFLHDIEAFAMGESWFGQAKHEDKILCLCIGTGAGSAFVQGKKVRKEETEGVPPDGWLYRTPFKDSIIDDYLSVRGLSRLSARICREALDGRCLFERSSCGDKQAIEVFCLFGKDLADALIPYLDDFRPDAVVLGGQISGSFCYFGSEFERQCKKRKIKVYLEPETSLRAVQGLYQAMNG